MAAKMIGCILLLCVAGTLAGPISWEESSSTCATECPDGSKFSYEPDTIYEYQYENDVQTSIPGSTEEQSSLHMRATVQIEVLSPCEMNLKLTDVSLQDSSPAQYESRQHVDEAFEFKRQLQEKALRFGFIDGRIEHICPESEPVWVLNIKRGIISAFQNTQTTLDAATKGRETDISGDCPVEYSVTGGGWSGKTVKKVKDMLGCTERHGHDSSFQGSPYEIDSNIKSMPLMKSSHECDQQINSKGLLTLSECKEVHVFRPFSDGGSGAQTMVNFKLAFTKQSRGVQTRSERVKSRSSLLFDHTLSPDEVDAKLQSSQQILRQLCKSSKEDIRPDTPQLFTELIKNMRTLDEDSLNKLFASAGSMCNQAEKYFRDAIPNIGTASSLSLIRTLIQQGSVDDNEAAVWLTHLAFVAQPTRAMLQAVKPLLTSSGVILRKSALSISSMVHNYCRLNTDCNTISEVREIVKVFEDNLSYNCKSGSPEQHETILMALKAIGNTGNSDAAAQTLARCFQNTEENNEVRVAAINAFRRMPCSAERNELMRLYRDLEADSELRINAYLMLMMCPNEDLVHQIKEALSEETINQVGSFVWTHLTNIMESSDPSKRDLRDLLQTIDLKAFDLDMRKFSRNMEWSLFSDMMNAGAKAESNVIFSSDSFVPRSAMVNLTVDMFGHSVNLIEAGGRVEGLDALLEKIFRPEDNSIRQKRDVIRPSLLDRINRQFRVAETDGPKASYFLKIFGNEIHYNDFHDVELGSLKDKVNYLDWLIKLSQDQEMDYTKSYMFLDSTLIVPTVVGLPLKLSVDGTATVNVKLNGKMDVRQMFSTPSTVDINGSIKPSAAVEVCGEMVVDAFVAKTGLKMVTTMHSSTITQGKISLLEGKVFHFDLEMPRDKQEIFSTESKFYIVHRADEREQQMIGQGRTVESSCYDLENPLGIELCGEFAMPVLSKEKVAKFPFTGPASTSLYINKKDTFTKYHIEGSYEVTKASGETELKLNINTPGSKVDREIDLFFNLNTAQKTVLLNLKSPWKKVNMNGEITNTNTLKRMSTKAIIDDRREYSFVSQLDIDEKKFATSYTPNAELAFHGQPTKTLTGQVVYRDNKKIEIDLALTNVFEEPITCAGSVLKVDNKKRMKYDISLNVASSLFKGLVDGFVDNQGDSISSRVTLSYKNAQNKQERIVFSNKMKDLGTKTLTGWSLNSALTTTIMPKYNADVSMDYTYGRNTMSASLDAGFDEQRRIKVTQSANFNTDKKEIKLDGMAKLEVPFKDIAYEVSVSHIHDMKDLDSKATIKYQGKTAEVVIDAKKESTNPVSAYLKVFVNYPGREMALSHEIVEKKAGEFHNDFVVQLDKYTKATAVAIYKMKPRHELMATINIPQLAPINIEGHLNPDLYDMQAHGAIKYDNKNYYVTSQWSAPKSMARDFSGEHTIRFGCPYRSMEISGKISQLGNVLNIDNELKLDADRNPDNKVSSSLSVTLNPTSPKVNMRAAWYPNKFVQIEAEGNYETEGWYRTTNDLAGSIKFTSSFPHLENINANLKHDYSHDTIATTGLVSWGPGQTINADFTFNKNTWQQVDTALTVGTPFPGYKNIKLSTTYKLIQKRLESVAFIQCDRIQVKVEAKGSADLSRHAIEGDASFSSPFPGFESITISGKHLDNGRNFNSNLDVSWAPTKKVTAKFTMEHQRNGLSINNNGELLVSTPVRSYKQNKLSWTHMNKDGSINTRIDADSDGVTSTVSVDGSLDSSPKKTVLTGNFMLDTPLASNIRVKINHLHNKKGIQSNALVQWAQNQVIEYIHDIKMDAWENLEVAAKLTTPFKSYNKVTFESKSTKNGQQINTQNEFKWSPNDKVNVDGTLSLPAEFQFNGQLRVTTPFNGFERTVLNLKNELNEELWISHADLDVANSRYEIDTKLGLNRRRKITIDTSKMEYGFLVDAEFTGNARDFTTLLSGKIPKLSDSPLGAELKVNYANLRNIKSSFTLNTPWREAQTVKASVGHRQPSTGSYLTDASFEMPAYKGSLSHTMNINGWTNFDSKSIAEYQNKKIELATVMKDSPKVEGRVTFNCPYTEPITFVVSHEGDRKAFKSGAELTYKNAQKISGDVDFLLRGTTLKANARIVSPYSDRVSASINHSGAWKNFQNDAAVEAAGNRVAAESKFEYNGNGIKTSASLELPLTSVRSIKAEYTHDGPSDNFKCASSLTVDGQTGTGTIEFKNAKVMSGKAEINTPFRYARLLKGEFNHDAKKWNSFENDGKFTWNNKEYSSNSELRWYGDTLRVNCNVKTPGDAYQLKFNHKGFWNDFKNTAIVDLSSGNKYNGESSFKATPATVEGSFSVETPHEGYERFAGEVSHSGNMNSFTSSAKIETPFKKLPSATVTVTHQGDNNEFACTAKVEYGRKAIAANANFKNAGRNIDGSASLTTTYPGYEKFEGSFSHTGIARNFKTNAEITTSFAGHDRYAAKMEHTGASTKNFKTSGEVNTPYSGYEKSAFNINHNGDLTGMTTAASVETSLPGYEKFDFNINHNGDPNNVRSMVELTTPIRGYEKFAVKVNHGGDIERFESGAEVQTPWRNYNFGGSIKHTGDLSSFNTEASLNLPIRGYQNWGIKVTHNGDLAQFTCSATLTMPFRSLPELKLNINHRGSLADFDSGISAEYNAKKIDAQGNWKYENSYNGKSYGGSLKMTSPYQYLQNLDVSGEHKREAETKSGQLLINHNSNQKVNLEYTYTTGATKNIRITFTEPKMFELLVNFEGTGPSFKSDATFNWERKTNVQLELNIKNQIEGDNVDRQVTFKTVIPSRELGFDVAYTRTAEKMTQTTEIKWDRDADSKMSYALELSSGTYRRVNYDGSFEFNSAIVDFQTTFNHMMVQDRQMTTQVSITMDETLTIKREATFHDKGMTLIFTTSHPRFSRDAILKIDANRDDQVLEGEIDLQFERESINFKGKIANEAISSGEMKYTAASQLTYPSMRLDMKFGGAIYNNQAGCGGNMEFNYLTTRDGMKTMTAKTTYDKSTRMGLLEVTNPMMNIKISGSETYHDDYNGIHRFSIVAEKDNQAVRTEFGLDYSGRKIEAKFYTPEDEMLHIYAQYMRPAVEFKVYRQKQAGDEVNDVLLNLNLDSDKLVTGAAYIRPQIWSDLKALFSNTDFQAKFDGVYQPVQRALQQELNAKQSAWERASERPRAAYNAVSEDLNRAATKISQAFQRAYRANEFYTQNIVDAVVSAYQSVKSSTMVSWRKLNRAMAPYIAAMQQWSKSYDKYMTSLKACMTEKYAQMGRMYNDAYDRAVNVHAQIRPHVDRAIQKVRAVYKQSKDTVMGAYENVKNHPNVQEMVKAVQDLQPSDIFAPLRKLKYRASVKLQQIREEHSTLFDALDEIWENIAQRQEIRDVAMFVVGVARKAESVWEKYDVSKIVKEWLKSLSKANWKSLKTQAINTANEYFQFEKTRWTTYDPLNGNFEFELYIPYDLKELHKLPKLDIKSYVRKAQQIMDDLTIDEDWSVWDTIYKYKPSLNVRDWVPPFKSHATIAGNQFIMTFDKMFYDFTGECSYLLARDFSDGHFSVIVNYQSQSGDVSKKSITVFSNQRQVEVFPDGHIMLDGANVEMPLEVEGTIIKRIDNKIFIDNKQGINIDCDLPHDRCTVAVSGWYFGKTAGLMGTYDNEPSNDLTSSDNTLARNIGEFAESWTMGPRCRSTNYAKTVRASPDTLRYQICAKYFEETTSAFRPCFKQVDPRPFMTMCLNDIPTNLNRMERDEDVCNVASYYMNECKKNNANIRLPRICVTCDLPMGGVFAEGENMTLTDADVPNTADVVFVVQHGACNKDVMAKIEDILNYFEKTFKAAGMEDIKYGIVGFGGQGFESEPHSHTIEGQLMSRSDKALVTLDTLTFDGQSGADVMSAVRFAALYPFRTGVSKSIIVLPCDDCIEGATRYTELQRILIERDITLHMLMDHTFKLKGTKSVSPKSGLMFGMDKNGLFIDKHVSDNELAGDAELRKQVTKPKDLCAALSEVTDGSVFSSTMISAQKSSVQKSFIDVMVRLMVKKAEPSICQMCECVADNAGVGQSVCHHCEMNPIYNILPEFEEYDYEDEDEEAEAEAESEEEPDTNVKETNKPQKKYGKNKDRVRVSKNKKNKDKN